MRCLYTSFPEGKIQKYHIEIGEKTADQLKKEMVAKNIYISDTADDLLEKIETLKKVEKNNLVRLTIKDLGFPSGATTDELYKKAEDSGLELCPAEVGPQLRLQNQSHDWMLIAMKQMTDRHGTPDIFSLYTNGEQLELHGNLAKPSYRWDSNHKFVFRLRKLET